MTDSTMGLPTSRLATTEPVNANCVNFLLNLLVYTCISVSWQLGSFLFFLFALNTMREASPETSGSCAVRAACAGIDMTKNTPSQPQTARDQSPCAFDKNPINPP